MLSKEQKEQVNKIAKTWPLSQNRQQQISKIAKYNNLCKSMELNNEQKN